MKVGMPKEAVANKCVLDGGDVAVLELSPDALIPLTSVDSSSGGGILSDLLKGVKLDDAEKRVLPSATPDGNSVAIQDHPVFSKYFKMLKVKGYSIGYYEYHE